jgi:hypothetical protein
MNLKDLIGLKKYFLSSFLYKKQLLKGEVNDGNK